MADKKKRVACIGECMIELAHRGPADLQLGFGGDTLNTAVYLSRLAHNQDIAVDYVTALGDDAYSDAMLAFWRDEGLGTDLVTRLPGRLPGLYTIRTDASGERSFTYWRERSAARDLLKGGRAKALREQLRTCDLIYLSGITLSILDQPQRDELIELVDAVRNGGGKIAFDGNFRPAGWASPDEARLCFDALLSRTDIALPTFDDEQKLMATAEPAAVAKRLHKLGVEQVVVKLGAEGCLLSSGDGAEVVTTIPIEQVTDSTAAGDSFNAGFLAGLLHGKTPRSAALDGHRLAAEVLRHRGAIIPREAMPELHPGPAAAIS